MKKYRTFEVSNDTVNLKGIIKIRLDEDEKSIFKKLRNIGFKINRRTNKLEWADNDYVEIINKRTDRTVGMMEVIYI